MAQQTSSSRSPWLRRWVRRVLIAFAVLLLLLVVRVGYAFRDRSRGYSLTLEVVPPATPSAKTALNVPLCIHPLDRPKLTNPILNLSSWTGTEVVSPDADETLVEGDTLRCGNIEFALYHVPGHSPGSLVFYAEGQLIAGDTVFYESVGRSDFPDASERQLYDAIRAKIYTLPDATIIYPGHGEPTTVGHEKLHNPFVRAS